MNTIKIDTIINKDYSEIIPYNYPNYKIFSGIDALSYYSNHTVPYHWHDDIELILPVSGAAIFNINGELIHVYENDGIFINSKQLHYIFSDNGSDCRFMYVVIHPELLCISEEIKNTFIAPVTTNNSIPYIHLNSDITWQNHILEYTRKICSSVSLKGAQLKIQSLFYSIWFELYNHIDFSNTEKQTDSYHLSALKQMIGFIQTHYADKITLTDISSSVNMGKSSCISLFKKYINTTPMMYVITYRLRKSCELLVQTDMSITEIAYDTGFSNSSYFVETFHKHYNCTPKEYRSKQMMLKSDHDS